MAYDYAKHIAEKFPIPEAPATSGLAGQLRSLLPKQGAEADYDVDALVDIASKANDGFDPRLIKAVMGTESSFNRLAVSPKKAMGLMQVIPSTWRAMAAETGLNDPFNPVHNAINGTRYLKQQHERFGGDIPLTLAAYNSGPENVEKYGGIPPFPETQDYVVKNLKKMGLSPEPQKFSSSGRDWNKWAKETLGEGKQAEPVESGADYGIFESMFKGGASGSVDAATTIMKAGTVLGIVDAGNWIQGIEDWKQDTNLLKEPPQDASTMAKWIHGAGRNFMQSIGSRAPAAAAGALVGGGVPGAVIGYVASGGLLYGLAEYYDFMKEAEKAGIPRDKVFDQAVISALAEGGFEYAGDILGVKVLGLLGKKVTTESVKAAVEAMESSPVKDALKKFATNTAKIAFTENISELPTTYVQQKEREAAGMPTGPMGEALLETFAQTTLSAPMFGAVGVPAQRRMDRATATKFREDEAAKAELKARLEEHFAGNQAFQQQTAPGALAGYAYPPAALSAEGTLPTPQPDPTAPGGAYATPDFHEQVISRMQQELDRANLLRRLEMLHAKGMETGPGLPGLPPRLALPGSTPPGGPMPPPAGPGGGGGPIAPVTPPGEPTVQEAATTPSVLEHEQIQREPEDFQEIRFNLHKEIGKKRGQLTEAKSKQQESRLRTEIGRLESNLKGMDEQWTAWTETNPEFAKGYDENQKALDTLKVDDQVVWSGSEQPVVVSRIYSTKDGKVSSIKARTIAGAQITQTIPKVALKPFKGAKAAPVAPVEPVAPPVTTKESPPTPPVTTEKPTEAKEPEAPPTGWRQAYAEESDPSRQADILRSIADISKSDKELSDVLDRLNGYEDSNIAWAVAQNPRASEATKARAFPHYKRNHPTAPEPTKKKPEAKKPEPAKEPAKEEAKEPEKKVEPSGKVAADFSGKVFATLTHNETGETFSLSLRPDNSVTGTFSVVTKNKDGKSSSDRMQYKAGMPIEQLIDEYQSYLNIDNEGQFTVAASEAKKVSEQKKKPAAPELTEDEAELKRLEAIRFKSNANEKAIAILKEKIAADPSKWSVGDGVGWRIGIGKGSQINRGFRIVSIDPENKTAVIASVADTGLTVTGGDRDVIGNETVHIRELVRDKKYDATKKGPPDEKAEAGKPGQAPEEAEEAKGTEKEEEVAPTEPVAEAEGPSTEYAYKSKGHVAFFKSPDGPWFELFKDEKGDLYRARDSAVIDMDTGNRIGRWEAPAHMADRQIDVLLGKEEKKPEPEVEPTAETPAEVEVTKENEKIIYEVRLGKRFVGDLTPKQQKAYLLKEVDAAIAAEKKAEKDDTDSPGRVRFEVPGDGLFEIVNSKEALAEFKKQVNAKFPASEVKPKSVLKTPSIKSLGKRLTGEVEYYNEFEPRHETFGKSDMADLAKTKDGFVSNGHMAVKNDALAANLEEKGGVLAAHMGFDKMTEPVELVGEYISTSMTYPLVHARSGKGAASYNASYIDLVLTEHPKAQAFSRKKFGEESPIIFKVGDEVVGVVNPVIQAKPTKDMLASFAERHGEKAGEEGKPEVEEKSTLADEISEAIKTKPSGILAGHERALVDNDGKSITIVPAARIALENELYSETTAPTGALGGEVKQTGTGKIGSSVFEVNRPYGKVVYNEATGMLSVERYELTSKMALGMDKDLLFQTVAKDIVNNDLAQTIANETIQNSVDEFPKNQKDKRIGIVTHWDTVYDDSQKIDIDATYVMVQDNASGMSKFEVNNYLMKLGAKGKSGTDTSGGYGMAKAALFLAPIKAKMTTVKNGKRTTVEGTREQFFGVKGAGKETRITEDAPGAPNGTTFEMWFYRYEDVAKQNNAYSMSPSEASSAFYQYIDLDKKGLVVPGVTIDLNGEIYETTPISELPKAYPSETSTVLGNTFTVHFPIADTAKPAAYGGEGWVPKVRAYNKGLGLLGMGDNPFGVGNLREKPEWEVVVDFDKTVEVKSVDYPFLRNRTQMNWEIQREVQKIVKKHIDAVNEDAFQKEKAAFDEMIKNSPVINGIRVLVPFQDKNEFDRAVELVKKNSEMVSEMADIFTSFQSLLDKIGEKKIELAITVDPKAHGWRSKPEATGHEFYAINPFAITHDLTLTAAWKEIIGGGYDSNTAMAANLVHALVHEYAHNQVSEHYESFTSELVRLYRLLSHTQLARLERQVRTFYENNLGVLETLQGDFANMGQGGSLFRKNRLAVQAPGGVEGIPLGRPSVQGRSEEGTSARAVTPPRPTITTDTPLFSRKITPAQAKGMPSEQAAKIVGEITAKWKAAPVFNFVDKVTDLSPELLAELAEQNPDVDTVVAFLAKNGEVWVISGKLADRDHLERVVLHESIGHLGVIATLGSRLNPVLDEIYAKYGRKGLQSLADEYKLDLSKESDRRIVAFEKLAGMAEDGKEATFVQRVYGVIRRFLKHMGFNIKMSDGEMLQLLQDSRLLVTQGVVPKGREAALQGQPLFMRGKPTPGDIALYHSTDKADDILKSGFDVGSKKRFGESQGGIYASPTEENAKYFGGKDVLRVTLPADAIMDLSDRVVSGELNANQAIKIGRESGAKAVKFSPTETLILDASVIKDVGRVQPLRPGDITTPEFYTGPADILFSRLKKEATQDEIDVAFGKNTDQKGLYELRIPAWLARSNEYMKRLFSIQQDRESKYSSEVFEMMNMLRPVLELSKEDTAAVSKVLFDLYGKKVVDTPKFVKTGERERYFGISKEVKTYDVLELNDKHYEELDEYLKKKDVPESVRKSVVAARRVFDEALLTVYETMQNIEKIDPTLIEKYRQSIGKIENYFPHMRYGNWYIQAIDPNPIKESERTDEGIYTKDATGKKLHAVKYRRHFNAWTERGARRWKQRNMQDLVLKEAREHDPNLEWDKLEWKIDRVKGNPEDIFAYPIPLEAMQQIVDQAIERLEMPENMTPLEKANTKESLRQLLSEEESNIIKARGFMQHFIQSKNIPGFEKVDIKRVAHDYTTGLVGMITKMEAANKFGDVLRDIPAKKEPESYKMSVRYVSDMLQNAAKIDKYVNNLRSLFFAKYLGAVLKTSVLNLTQNVVAGVPSLSMHTSGAFTKWARAIKDIRLSVRSESLGRKTSLSETERQFLLDMVHEGWGQAKLVTELTGRMGAFHEQAWQKAIRFAGLPMEIAERYNRLTIGLAAFRTAVEGKITNEKTLAKYGLEKGEKASVEIAKDFARDEVVGYAHFYYGKGNRPQIFRGSRGAKVASTGYTFRTFNHNLFAMWRDMLSHEGTAGKRAFAYSIGNMMILAGLSGIPFYRTLATVIRQLFGKDPLGEEILKATPNRLRDFVLYGAPTFLGIDLSGSIGIEIPGLGRRRIGESTAQRVAGSVGDVIGIPWALFQELTDSMDAVAKGRLDRVPEILSPVAIKNILAAVRLSTEGATTMSGKPIARPGEKEPRKLTAKEAFLKGLGFQPISKTKEFQLYRTLSDLQVYKANKQTEWANELAVATRRHDTAKVRNVNKEIQEFNAKMRRTKRPEMVIDIKDALRARMKPQQAPKAMRGKELEYAELYQLRDNLKKGSK